MGTTKNRFTNPHNANLSIHRLFT